MTPRQTREDQEHEDDTRIGPICPRSTDRIYRVHNESHVQTTRKGKDMDDLRDCLCADPENCREAVPNYRCKAKDPVVLLSVVQQQQAEMSAWIRRIEVERDEAEQKARIAYLMYEREQRDGKKQYAQLLAALRSICTMAGDLNLRLETRIERIYIKAYAALQKESRMTGSAEPAGDAASADGAESTAALTKLSVPPKGQRSIGWLLNSLVLTAMAKARNDGVPSKDRITDADVESIEREILDAIAAKCAGIAPVAPLDHRLLDMAITWREQRCGHTANPDDSLAPYCCVECIDDATVNIYPLLVDAVREAVRR